jgi:Predicted membrane protein (DUF2142)
MDSNLGCQVAMRTGRVAPSFASAIAWLLSSLRRVWWTTFALATLLSGLWSLANPPFAGPDEPAHVIRAHAIDRGELTGRTPSRRLLARLGGDRSNLVVRAPEVYVATGIECFAFDRNVTAECLRGESSRDETDALTSAARHPPAYYAAVGVVSFVSPPGSGTVYLMRLLTGAITGAFVATAVTALRRTAGSGFVAIGLLFAITPMVLFVSGIVNPNAPEIAAALALWVCGLQLVCMSGKAVDKRLVTAVGISGCTLALSRQLAPLWLGLIALTIFGFANRASLRNLVRSGWARLWAALITACAVAQLGWVYVVKPLDTSHFGRHRINVPTSEVVRWTLGAGFGRYREIVGVFGWLDTPAPMLTHLLWTAGVGFLIILAVTWSRRRHVALLLGLIVATIVVPVILESIGVPDVGSLFWQGRYTLPLALGIPVLSAMAIASTRRGRQLTLTPRLVLAVGVAVSTAQVLAFAQNLRRYTVGYDGPIPYWRNPRWSPPLSPLLLTLAYAIAIAAFVSWTFACCRRRDLSAGAYELASDTKQVGEPRDSLGTEGS